ncbi:MAG: hypothetical protein KC441_00755 [Anaerolineales bacterium]|nr:hypothetical protein [Anaerolineales bacterium]
MKYSANSSFPAAAVQPASAANPYLIPQSSHRLTMLAWGAVLLVSTLPDILWIEKM